MDSFQLASVAKREIRPKCSLLGKDTAMGWHRLVADALNIGGRPQWLLSRSDPTSRYPEVLFERATYVDHGDLLVCIGCQSQGSTS